MKNSLMVILASAFGGLIGTLTASQLGIFWWIGMIVGFLTGFLSFKFGDVLRAIKYAWKKVIGWKLSWRFSGQTFLTALSAYIWLIFVISSLVLIVSGFQKFLEMLILSGMASVTALTMVPIISLFSESEIDKNSTNLVKAAWKYNVLFVLLYHLPKFIFSGIVYVVPRIPKSILIAFFFLLNAVITFGRFIKTIFIMIYSELRVLCGICGAVGTVIGHLYYDNAIIGMIAGGAFGVLNYLLISKGIFRKQVKAYQEAKTT